MKKGKRLVDVLSEVEKKTFITETVIPKLHKLMNMIRSAEQCDVREKDYNTVGEMVRDMERSKIPYNVSPSDLKWCNTLYNKYRQLDK